MVRGVVGITAGVLFFLAVTACASGASGRIRQCRVKPELVSCQRFADRKVSRLRDSRGRSVSKAAVTLARLGDPRVVPWLRENLVSPVNEKRDLAVEAAIQLRDPARAELYARGLQGDAAGEAANAIWFERGQVVDAMSFGLYGKVLLGGSLDPLEGLKTLERHTPEDLPADVMKRAEELARRHPRRSVRLRARDLLRRAGVADVVLGEQQCPEKIEMPKVQTSNETYQLTDLRSVPTTSYGPDRSKNHGRMIRLKLGDRCIAGIDLGEFGGSIEANDCQGSTPVVLADRLNPKQILEWSGGVAVLEGLWHIDLSMGSIVLLGRTPKGAFAVGRRIFLSGQPLAYAQGDDGSLLVLVEYDRDGTPSCPTQTEDRVRDRVLVKAFPDGRLLAAD